MFPPFKGTLVLFASKTKNRLAFAVNANKVPLDRARLERAQMLRLREKNQTPVSNDAARKLVAKVLEKPVAENVRISATTPFTEHEIEKLFRVPNERFKYNILGINGNQLSNSVTVNKKTEALLENGDLPRAIELARLARNQGIFSFGTIFHYLANRGKLNRLWDLFNKVKKWGQRPDGRMLAVLFAAHANAKHPKSSKALVTKAQAIRIRDFLEYEAAKQKNTVDIRHVNSVLKALRLAGCSDEAVALFEKVPAMKMRYDSFTYTEYFSALRHTEDYTAAITKAETQFSRLQTQKTNVDERLVQAYSALFVFADDVRLRERGLLILRKWFNLCDESAIEFEAGHVTDPSALASNNSHPRVVSPEVDLDTVLLAKSDINKRGVRMNPSPQTVKRHGILCKYFELS
ncbi:hypothetical protein OGAPHI_005589 [Ogataea philodendri]|uniref:Mitochondrial group I intron splicing factor CCM1 n=1 Tax=Ogataea philodendri TaxID=1378263 RepID=A0A9P8P006_9ASCO|nr:uncharacterized protein OGAPHI_005589 [Ogataea philodendri]KAH3662337.1 hypothetical protein OGAPHI_005589 [Ogataea philodendri]